MSFWISSPGTKGVLVQGGAPWAPFLEKWWQKGQVAFAAGNPCTAGLVGTTDIACLCRMVISVSTYASHPTAVLSVGNVLPFPSRCPWLPLWLGSESCILLAALLSLTGCPGARISLRKPEMAARQVSCQFPCSSFLLLAERNLIFFLAIIMGCEEQLLN